MPLLHQQQPAFVGESEGTVGDRAELAAVGVSQQAKVLPAIYSQQAAVVFEPMAGLGLTDPAAEILLSEPQRRLHRSGDLWAENVHR
jgi:hypothetical protein